MDVGGVYSGSSFFSFSFEFLDLKSSHAFLALRGFSYGNNQMSLNFNYILMVTPRVRSALVHTATAFS